MKTDAAGQDRIPRMIVQEGLNVYNSPCTDIDTGEVGNHETEYRH